MKMQPPKSIAKLVAAVFASLLYLALWSRLPANKANTYPIKLNKIALRPLNNLPSTFGSVEWRQYLPEVEDLLNKIEQGVITLPKDIRKTTDPKSSVIQYLNDGILQVGQRISGKIQACDFEGAKKKHGGDHYRARLMKLTKEGNLTKDGIAVIVNDHNNGTYSWNTIIPWPGRCKLIIELVHSSEAVVDLIVQRSTLVNKQRGFQGLLPNDRVVNCDIAMSEQSSICNYSRPEHGITWVCSRPNSNETCPKVIPMYEITNKKYFVLGSQPLFKVGVNWQVELKNSGKVFDVAGNMGDMPRSTEECHMTTGMTRYDYLNVNSPSGYYNNKQWISLLCDNKHKNLKSAKKCLQKKSIYFIGDSTMRQWYMSDILKVIQVNDSATAKKTRFRTKSRNGFNAKLNIDIHIRSHGNPLHNPGPPESRPYIVDTLASIPNSDNTIVVFNIGAHFMPYDPSVIMQRVSGIKNAFVALHQRSPSVKVFLRGPIRFTGTFQGPLSEWLYMRTDRILRRYFSDLPYVGYIGTWEITTVLPQPSVHAGKAQINDFISLFLSYAC